MLLNNNDKRTILQILDNSIKTSIELWAFGSRVNNRAHSGSDLDLVIRTKDNKPLDFKEFISFKEGLRESNIPFLVDVLDWNSIPNYFKDNIKKQYKVLKEL